MPVRPPDLDAALAQAAHEAERAARRHDTDVARALRDALRAARDRGGLPDRAWLAAAIRDTADWATGEADIALLASLGAIARASPQER
jgi:hypothetical protein